MSRNRITEADLRRATGGAGVSKYRNRKVTLCGHKFDSQKEANRYVELRLLVKQGEIHALELQKRFPLKVNGILVCHYVADFVYWQNGNGVVEDVKSDFTRKNLVYRIKCKLMKAVHGIEIREV